jgi:hypothetical protein
VGLELGPPSLVSTIEELLERKSSSGSSLENREYGRRDSSRRPRGTLYPQTLALSSLTSGGRSVGIVRSRTQATEFSLSFRKPNVSETESVFAFRREKGETYSVGSLRKRCLLLTLPEEGNRSSFRNFWFSSD